MNFRTILVHLDESPRCAVRVDISARLAREHRAHLIGLAPAGVINLPARVVPSSTGVPNYLELAQATLSERAAALVQDFRERTRVIGVESVEGRVDEDDVVPSLLRYAGTSDLVVVGQVDRASTAMALDADVPEQLFMHTGTPALVVPYAGTFADVGQSVVIAWNATRESTRAVRDALPLLRRARDVHLMCFYRAHDARQVSRLELNDAQQWLIRHGVEAHVHQEIVEADVGEVLLSRACDLSADLIVMGGYGHSRMAEWLLGGVTRRLLAQMTVPVILSH
jgi:nucleotide-binding universal stress UspA family protein